MNGRPGGVRVSLHGGHTDMFDGAAPASDMVEAALAAGLEIFGLSEHFYRPRDPRLLYPGEPAELDFGQAPWPSFVDDVLEIKDREALPIKVLLGAEVEYLPGRGDWTRKELARWPLDFVVLSVHFLELAGNLVPFELRPQDWQQALRLCKGDRVELYCCYYDHVLAALDWGIADVLGHIDVIKIHDHGPLSHPRIDARLDKVLRACAKSQVALDLNPRGLIKPCREIYPSLAILEQAHRAGVSVVPGDDSHSPGDVGKGLDQAAEHARRAGYTEVCLPPRLGGECFPLS